MKVTTRTVKPMLVTACVTIVILALINNVDSLKPIKEQVNGSKGWF